GLWSGEAFDGGQWRTISAPIGQPPVFFIEDGPYAALFREIGRL
ncbi:MAG: hypothetical protein AAF205_07475, partial [Pseudomonadota bacterium]